VKGDSSSFPTVNIASIIKICFKRGPHFPKDRLFLKVSLTWIISLINSIAALWIDVIEHTREDRKGRETSCGFSCNDAVEHTKDPSARFHYPFQRKWEGCISPKLLFQC